MNLNILEVVYSTLKFLALTLPIIAIVSYITSLLINRGSMEKIAQFLEPILAKLNLSQVTVVSTAVCFLSATASYSILSQALREGKISDKEVIAVSFINSFPATLTHVYGFFIPFVIPVLGVVGVFYTILRLAVALIKSFLGLFLAWKWRSERECISIPVQQTSPLLSVFDTVKKTLPIMAVTFIAIQFLSQLGVFDELRYTLDFIPLNPSVIAISVVEFFNTKAAVVMSAGLLQNKEISEKWVIVALMLANVATFSTRYVKHSLPLHVSLFGRLGLKIVALNAAVSLILDAIVIAGVILFL